jgi:type IV pilus assembly protein PilW
VKARRRNQRGFTLIELMVSLVLFALVVTGLMAVAVSMVTGYRDQEVTISAEAATRSTLDFMADGLRNASTGVATYDTLVDLDVASCPTGAFSMTNNAVNPAPLANRSDTFTMTFASGSVITTLTGTYDGISNTTVGVADARELAANDFAIITDFSGGHLVHLSASSGTKPGTITIDSAQCTGVNAKLPTGGYLAGSTVIRAMRATFAIGVVPSDEALVGSVPVLTMDADAEGNRFTVPEPIAEGIEDIQIVYGADTNNDGLLSAEDNVTANADEWFGNVIGENVPLPIPSSVRAIRISIVARTIRQFAGNATFKLNALEDRTANTANDNFRRRILSTTVEIRNLSGSP